MAVAMALIEAGILNIKTIKTQRNIKRTDKKCPHYAMSHYGIPNVGSNQCPLKSSYAPCEMEVSKQEPDWEKCKLNPEKRE